LQVPENTPNPSAHSTDKPLPTQRQMR
jgi:hypothetical protein